MDNPVAANILGTAGAVCWSIQVSPTGWRWRTKAHPYRSFLIISQLLPQIVKNFRRHSTEGLHHTMYFSWAIAGIPLGVYNLVKDFNVALKVQPHILIFLSLVTWGQCQYYGARWSPARVLGASAATGAGIGGVECGLYFALREARRRGLEWPLILMAALAAFFLMLGVLRYYWEIYKSRSVQGISFMFVIIDAGGDLVSILALLFEASIDALGLVIYSVELGFWIGILALGMYYRLWGWMSSKIGARGDEETTQARAGNGDRCAGESEDTCERGETKQGG